MYLIFSSELKALLLIHSILPFLLGYVTLVFFSTSLNYQKDSDYATMKGNNFFHNKLSDHHCPE